MACCGAIPSAATPVAAPTPPVGGGDVAPVAPDAAAAPGASAPTTFDAAATTAQLADISDRLRAAIAAIDPDAGTASPGGFIVPGRLATGATAIDPAAAPAGLRLSSPQDDALFGPMLNALDDTPTGQALVAGLKQVGATVTLLDDAQMTANGHEASGGYYDPSTDTIFMRRSSIQSDIRKAAATFAHEATHALDDKGGVGKAWLDMKLQAFAAAGTTPTAQQLDQLRVELSLAREARGFTIHATAMRELGAAPEGILSDVVRTGANDQATYEKIFRMLVEAGPAGGYNTTGQQVQPFVL